MNTVYNENNVKRTAFAQITLPSGTAVTAATTLSSGVYIPKGAIVTGIRWNAPTGLTNTAASQTVQIRIGSVNICTTIVISTLAAQTVPVIGVLATTGGNALTVDSEFNVLLGATSSSTAAGTYDFYVDYLYTAGN